MNVIRKPSIEMYPAVRVDADTVLEYTTETLTQHIENLEFRNTVHIKGDNYESTVDTRVQLEAGDILIFENGGRGYIKPVEDFVDVEEAIAELECIKGVGEG